MIESCAPPTVVARATYVILAAVFLLSACADDPSGPSGPSGPGDAGVASVSISPGGPTEVAEGDSIQLVATARSASGALLSGQEFIWSTANEAVATVTSQGLVRGVGKGGPVTVSARVSGVSASTQVRVAARVASVVIEGSASTLIPGETRQLTARLYDADGDALQGRSVEWSSSDPSILEVSGEGLLTALAEGGPVMVGARSEGRMGIAAVQVEGPASSLEVIPSRTVLTIDSEHAFAAIALDASGNPMPDRAVTWSSSNPAVVSMDPETGEVTVHSVGSAVVTAQSGPASATATVDVVAASQATLSGGYRHSCGVTTAGEAYCWGLNSSGQLGSGTGVHSEPRPVPVAGGLTFRSVFVGSRSTCGLTTDGGAYCWGRHFASTPVRATSDLTFTQLSMAQGQSNPHVQPHFSFTACGIGTDGDTYCWGDNQWGQFGDGTTQPSAAPVKVPGGHRFTQIVTGSSTCALDSEGRAYCWGHNQYRSLGVGSTNVIVPEPTPVLGGLQFTELSGVALNRLGLTGSGELYQWGNHSGEHAVGLDRPMQVMTGTRFNAIAAARWHRCAVTVDRVTYCWGENRHGQVGTGYAKHTSSDYINDPVRVVGGLEFIGISAGVDYTFGVAPNGDVWAWGASHNGEMGIPSNPSPTLQWDPRFTLEVTPDDVSLEAGRSTQATLTLRPGTGGFNIHGVRRFNDVVNLEVNGVVDGVHSSFQTETLSLAHPTTKVGITISPSTPAKTYTLLLDGIAHQREDPAFRTHGRAQLSLTVTAPSTTGGGELDLVCHSGSTPLPTGYHCLTNEAGQHVPGKFDMPSMHGTWVDVDAAICVTWNANGTATGRYKAGQLGEGAVTQVGPGKWGVIVRRSGEPEGDGRYKYVFTAPLDPQTALLPWDSQDNRIATAGFAKQSCPW